MQGERVLQTALLDARDHRLRSLDRALHTTRLPSDDAVPALFVAVGLPVLDELLPSLELLLNAPGARANHAVPAVVLEGEGAGREELFLVFRMSLRVDLVPLLQEVKGDCEFVVGRRVPQRLVQLSAPLRRKMRKSYKRKCPCKGVGGTQYGADAAVTHVLLRDPRAAA